MNNDPKRPSTPREVVQKLDKFIIGQERGKRQLAIAERNRWRRMQSPDAIRKEISPANMIIIGPTGTGKTELGRRLAEITNAPFIKKEATKFTERGYVGGDVDSMVRELAERAFEMVKREKEKEVKAKAAKRVDDIILDILIPLKDREKNNSPLALDPEKKAIKDEPSQRARALFLEKIRRKELDNYMIEISVSSSRSQTGSLGFIGGNIDESAMMNIENMLSRFIPKSKRKKKVTITEARKILLEEEVNKLLDLENIKEEAVKKAEYEGIIFIDEIDKIASTGHKTGVDVSREGVQRDLLPIVEGSNVQTKYGSVRTDHILFIAAGAFHISSPSDLIAELQGRFPIRVKLDSLTERDFERILQEPSNSLIKQYQALFSAEKVDLSFTLEAIKEIAKFAFEANQTMEDIGARRLLTVMSHLLGDPLFDMPEDIKPGEKVAIDQETVQKRLHSLKEGRGTKQYII